MNNNELPFFEWITRVKYALIAAGVFNRGNYGVSHIKINEEEWKKNFYNDGFSPFEAVWEDFKNQ